MRLNTHLQAAGAEFLVLGRLLVEGIETHKSYMNNAGYDLVALQPDKNRSCRISIKSRYASDFDGGFPIKNLDFDFVVLVALNKGNRYSRKAKTAAARPPDYWVLPVTALEAIRRGPAEWHKVYLRDLSNAEEYVERWDLIAEFLAA